MEIQTLLVTPVNQKFNFKVDSRNVQTTIDLLGTSCKLKFVFEDFGNRFVFLKAYLCNICGKSKIRNFYFPTSLSLKYDSGSRFGQTLDMFYGSTYFPEKAQIPIGDEVLINESLRKLNGRNIYGELLWSPINSYDGAIKWKIVGIPELPKILKRMIGHTLSGPAFFVSQHNLKVKLELKAAAPIVQVRIVLLCWDYASESHSLDEVKLFLWNNIIPVVFKISELEIDKILAVDLGGIGEVICKSNMTNNCLDIVATFNDCDESIEEVVTDIRS
ncbi:hypothetical protein CHUAL_013336 [Chamberlinius hualienensis]